MMRTQAFGIPGLYIFFKIAVIELMAVPEGHERDEKGHDENEGIKIIAHVGIETQAPDARDNSCKGHENGCREGAVGDKQQDRDEYARADHDPVHHLYIACHHAQMHGMADDGNGGVFVFGFQPQLVEGIFYFGIIKLLLEKIGEYEAFFRVKGHIGAVICFI